MEKEQTYTELDARTNDGKFVQLLWSPETNETFIRIEDFRKEETIQFAVLGEKALEAFNHPYPFAPTSKVG